GRRGEDRGGLLTCLAGGHLTSMSDEDPADDVQDAGLIVDDEDAVHHCSQKHRNDNSLSPAQGLEKPLHRLSKY
ncbi:MAG: hypothetical protein ACPGSP_03045, partial [Alphaproteobacteria bacterium]